MPVNVYILTAFGAYLLGSIPFGFLMAKAKGIDIRSVGSGNIGATNAMRVLGKPVGISVLLLDALKGFAACTWFVGLVVKFFTVGPEPLESQKVISASIGFTPEQVGTLQIIAGICGRVGLDVVRIRPHPHSSDRQPAFV